MNNKKLKQLYKELRTMQKTPEWKALEANERRVPEATWSKLIAKLHPGGAAGSQEVDRLRIASQTVRLKCRARDYHCFDLLFLKGFPLLEVTRWVGENPVSA